MIGNKVFFRIYILWLFLLGAGFCFAQPADTVLVQQISFSKDTLDGPLDYGAVDSMWMDLQNRIVHLYGEAFVRYEGLSLTAAYIKIDLKNSVAEAEAVADSSGAISGMPHFEQADQIFDAKKLAYNFKSRKGLIYDVATVQNDLYIRGGESKFFGGDPADSTADKIAYSKNAFFTTCNDDHPHFGVRSTKQKVIAGKLIVIGPSQLEIGDVPTPLYLPFGFFPITKSKRHGLLTPRDITFDVSLASYGLRGLGYYIPLGDHAAITTRNDFYWNGSYNITTQLGYLKRYKYRGEVDLGYSRFRRENPFTSRFESEPSFSLRWAYNQDQRAHPTFSFGASVNIQTNNYQSRNRNDARSVLNNALSSNISFTKSFPGKPYSLNGGLNHSQNNQTRQVAINFPTLNFQMQRIFPFKRKLPVGEEKWFEKLSFKYDGALKSKISAVDSVLFKAETLERAVFGINHTVGTDASYRIFKYLNISPSINYKESWYFRTVGYDFKKGLEIQQLSDTLFNVDGSIRNIVFRNDTTAYGRIDTNFQTGLRALRLFNASIGTNTQLFGTVRFKAGPLRGLRHTAKPGISISYAPDYGAKPFSYFDSVVVINRRGEVDTIPYTPFQFGAGLLEQVPNGGRSMSMNFSLNNIFEAKIRGRKDSVDRRIKLLDNVNFTGGYNFLNDTMPWSPVNASAAMRLFKGLTVLSARAQWDPYLKDAVTNRRTKNLVWDANKRPLRFEGMTLDFNTGLTVKQLRDALAGLEPEVYRQDTSRQQGKQRETAPQLLDLFDNFRFNHSLSIQRVERFGRDTTIVVNTINFVGDIELTDNWNFTVGNIGYDFNAKSFTYPDLGIYRDLHCWEMGANWQPNRGTYSFFIRVKTGSLDFLRLPYNKAFPDNLDF